MKQRERQWQPLQLGGDVPPPVGAYSPAARAGGFVFVSGQVPRDPVTGALVGDDIESQTKQVIANVKRALEPRRRVARGRRVGHRLSRRHRRLGRFNTMYKELMPTPIPDPHRARGQSARNLRGDQRRGVRAAPEITAHFALTTLGNSRLPG